MIDFQPGYLTGAVAISGPDFHVHSIAVTVEDDAPVGVPLDMNGSAFVAIAYDVDGNLRASGTFLASAGTVTLTRRCDEGLAGSLYGVELSEVDSTTLLPVTGARATTLPSLDFDSAAPCS
jgi:hypothetical protein